MKKLFILLVLPLLFAACTESNHKTLNGTRHVAVVQAVAETEAVKSHDDAADDPAIWYNPKNPSESRIYGTDKQSGIMVYNLNGELLFDYPLGRFNNIDLRYGFVMDGDTVDILGGSNRTNNSISFYRIEPDSGKLEKLHEENFISEVDEVYGFAMFHNPKTNSFYAFVNSKSGQVEQYRLYHDSVFKAELVRSFKIGGQTEGMVADDELGYFYIGQENRGIWKMLAVPGLNNDKFLLTDSSKNYIVPDVEGLAIYYAANKKGYLIASIQGNNTFAIFERDFKNRYVGSFGIGDGAIDGAEETDGIDVINLNLGSKYPDGVFVAQDGFNTQNGDSLTQNFKIVSWTDIASVYEPGLLIDNTYILQESKNTSFAVQ